MLRIDILIKSASNNLVCFGIKASKNFPHLFESIICFLIQTAETINVFYMPINFLRPINT